MPEGKAHPAAALDCVDHLGEEFELVAGIGLAVRSRLVGDGEMRVDTLNFQIRQGDGLQQVLHALLEVAPCAEKAQPGHAGVQFDVDLQLPAELSCRLGIFPRFRQRADGLGDMFFQQHFGIFRRRVAEDQDRHGDAAFAQLQRLV